jgi:hypothetical protein
MFLTGFLIASLLHCVFNICSEPWFMARAESPGDVAGTLQPGCRRGAGGVGSNGEDAPEGLNQAASEDGRYWARSSQDEQRLVATEIDSTQLAQALGLGSLRELNLLPGTLLYSALGQLRDVVASSDVLHTLLTGLLRVLVNDVSESSGGTWGGAGPAPGGTQPRGGRAGATSTAAHVVVLSLRG